MKLEFAGAFPWAKMSFASAWETPGSRSPAVTFIIGRKSAP